MKRSDINALVREAAQRFEQHGWALPPKPRWDVTDFGLGDWRRWGLVLVNLAEEAEYCEKLMFAKRGMVTPAHCHRVKKEDIVARAGSLGVTVWNGFPGQDTVSLKVNGTVREVASGSRIELKPGERITLGPGVYHEFEPTSDYCIIGEVSTANDDVTDNIFANPAIGRFPGIEEDEPPIVRLVSDRA